MGKYNITVDTHVDTSQLDDAEKLINNLNGKLIKLKFDVDGISDIKDINSAISKKLQIGKKPIKIPISFTDDLTNGKIKNQLENLIYRYNQIGNSATSGIQNNLRNRLEQLDNIASGGASVEQQTRYWADVNREIKNATATAKMYEDAVKRASKDTKLANSTKSLEQAKKNFGLRIDTWLKNNSAASLEFEDRLRNIQTRIQECNNTASLNNLKGEFQQVTLEAEKADKATLTFGDRLKRQAREYASYVGVATLTMAGGQALRQMTQNVIDIDTAMTGLYRVTDLTSKQYDELYSKMIADSKEYGTTLTDTINATSDWVRAGFGAEEALGLADITAMYQHVSDLDYNEAVENLLTSYNGFKASFNEEFGGDAVASVLHIADVFNELDNQYSITSAGLGEGLARSASALELAGNTFEESAALIGATAEVTQDPEKAGNAMKTLSLRLRGMKGELEELGEDTEGIENLSKMQGQILNLTKGKVNIFEDDGSFKSTYQIMLDIANVYDKLTDTEQADLLETIAGKNRANDVAALIGNMDTAVSMVETAENAAGSAAAENAKYLESLQGRIDVMKSSLQALSSSAIDSGFLKGAISGVTSLADMIASLVDSIGIVPTALGLASAGFAAFGNEGIINIDKANNRLQIFGKSLEEIKTIYGTFKSNGASSALNEAMGTNVSPFEGFNKKLEQDKKIFDEYISKINSGASQSMIDDVLAGSSDELRNYINTTDKASRSFSDFSTSQKSYQVALQAQNKSIKSAIGIIGEYNIQCKNIGMTQSDFADAVSISNPVLGTYLSGLNGAEATMSGYVTSLVGATAKTVALTAASAALNAALTAGISIAIGAVISGISKLITYYDDLGKAVDESSSAFEQSNNSLLKNQSSYNQAVQTYDKLSKGVNSLGENIGLTSDEYEEYQNAVNTIADVSPSMVAGFDAQGNAILSTAANVNTLTEAYNQLLVAEANAFLSGDEEKGYVGLDKIIEDYQHQYSKFKNAQDTTLSIDDILNSSDINKAISELNSDELANITKELQNMGYEADSFLNTLERTNSTSSPTSGVGLRVSDTLLNNTRKDFVEKTLESENEDVRNAVSKAKAQYDAEAQALNQAAMAMLQVEMYDGGKLSQMDDGIQNLLTQYVSGLDSTFWNDLFKDTNGEEEAKQALTDYISNITSSFENLDEASQSALNEALDFKLEFDYGNISMDEYAKQAEKLNDIFDEIGLDGKAKEDIMLTLGFEYEDGELQKFTKDYESALARFGGEQAEDSIKDWLGGLSGNDLSIVMDMELSGDETIDELQHALDLTKALNNVGQIDIGIETENIDKLNSAISQSDSATGLTTESIDALNNMYSQLDSYDPSRLFERTANGIHLNTQALRDYQSEYEKTNKDKIEKDLSTLRDEYDRLTKSMEGASSPAETAMIEAQRQNILDEISSVADLAAQYDGLTSSYNKWLQAKSGSEQGDMYDDIYSGIESTKELYDSGLVGTNEFREFVQMMTDEDLTNASTETIMGIYEKGMPLMERYFTEGANGAQTFLSDIQNINSEWAHMNEDGSWDINFGVGNDKEIADALGISVDEVQAIMRKLSDYGFDINLDSEFTGLEELKTKAEEAEETLNQLATSGKLDFDYDFNFETDDIDYLNEQIKEAESLLDGFRNEDGTVNINAEGAEEAQTILATLMQQKASLEQPAIMSVEVEDPSSEVGSAIASVQSLYSAITERNINIAIGADASAAEGKIADIAGQLSALQQNNPELYAQLGLDTSDFNAALSTLQNVSVGVDVNTTDINSAISTVQSTLQNIDVSAYVDIAGVDQSSLQGLTGTATVNAKPATKDMGSDFTGKGKVAMTPKSLNMGSNFTGTGKVSMSPVSRNLGSNFYGTGTVTITRNYKDSSNNKPKGRGSVNSTAHSNGTAFAEGSGTKKFKKGDWAIHDSGTALVGELGQEIVVRDGRYFTVGDNGAEFFRYQPGDIIFNHKQSEELLKNGYVTSNGGRGRAYVDGTAFSSGSGGFWGGGRPSGSGSTSSNVSKGNSVNNYSDGIKEASDEAKEFKEIFDLIEIAIDRVERAIDRLDKIASSTFKDWSTRTEALNNQINETVGAINLQYDAYNRYMQEANSVGLSADWVSKIQNGQIDITTITDEGLKEKIDNYQKWYEKALDVKDAIDDLNESLGDLYSQKFENIQTKFDGILGPIQHVQDMLEESISQTEEKGWVVSSSYYSKLIENQKEQNSQLEKQKQEMLAQLQEGIESGAIQKGSESWYLNMPFCL